MTEISAVLAAAAQQVADLEAQRDQLLAKLRDVNNNNADLVRRMYRRGYLAGRAAARRGAPALTNPERHARTEVRELLR